MYKCNYCEERHVTDEEYCPNCGAKDYTFMFFKDMEDLDRKKARKCGKKCPYCGGTCYKMMIVSRRTVLFSNKWQADVYKCCNCKESHDGEWYNPYPKKKKLKKTR